MRENTMRVTRIHQVGANYDNLDATDTFYSSVLGARRISRFDPPGILFYEFAGTRLIFEHNTHKATLYFWVDDLDASWRVLADRGVEFSTEPHLIHRDDEGVFDNPGTEEWMAFFMDPGGNTLALATRR